MGLYGSYFQAMGLIKILANGKIFNQQHSLREIILLGHALLGSITKMPVKHRTSYQFM